MLEFHDQPLREPKGYDDLRLGMEEFVEGPFYAGHRQVVIIMRHDDSTAFHSRIKPSQRAPGRFIKIDVKMNEFKSKVGG